MQRYDFNHGGSALAHMPNRPNGEFVRYEDAQAIITKLISERDAIATELNRQIDEAMIAQAKAETERDEIIAAADKIVAAVRPVSNSYWNESDIRGMHHLDRVLEEWEARK